MKREIKFKGKVITTDQWIYGYYTRFKTLGQYHHFIYDEGNVSWEVDPETVGQYTGLKDRNGKEIYEGDIVKTSWYNELLEVIYLEYQFLFEIKASVNYKFVSFDNFEWPDDFEVIGNRWSNPDLLEG